MEIAEIATLVFVAGTMSYRTARHWRNMRQYRKFTSEDIAVSMTFALPEEVSGEHVSVLAFNNRGDLAKKIPQAVAIVTRRRKCRVRCLVPHDVETVCVIVGTGAFSVSGIETYLQAQHFHKRGVRLWIGGGDVIPANDFQLSGSSGAMKNPRRKGKLSFELKELVNTEVVRFSQSEPVPIEKIIPREVNTDAMAKCLRFDAYRMHCEWSAEIMHIDQPEQHWITLVTADMPGKFDAQHLIIRLKANFTGTERRARIEVHTEQGVYCFTLCQRVMGEHPDLCVSRTLYVCDGSKREEVSFTVSPESGSMNWQIKKVMTSDGGRWWRISPKVGEPLTGLHNVLVQLEPKPANVHSRTAVVTLETGTYPFNRTVNINVMQGLRFDYYIEYPKNDPCTRHSGVIETPLSYKAGDPTKIYTVRVDSNQPWRIVTDETVKWLRVEQYPVSTDLYSAVFMVKVDANTDNIKNGIPAARSTVLSLITDTGIVRDILVYQGGYVRIKGICWLDRNLAAPGLLTQVAIPTGLGEGNRLTWGSYFRFGSPTDAWSSDPVTESSWLLGTEETPVRCGSSDPCSPGWRLPSRLEMSQLAASHCRLGDVLDEDTRNNICLFSDDGVPVYLPFCGHLSHINGSWIDMPHCNRYWCGTSQSAIYGHSLCIEPGKQMYLTHDMKKYGFPVRGVLAEE